MRLHNAASTHHACVAPCIVFNAIYMVQMSKALRSAVADIVAEIRAEGDAAQQLALKRKLLKVVGPSAYGTALGADDLRALTGGAESAAERGGGGTGHACRGRQGGRR